MIQSYLKLIKSNFKIKALLQMRLHRAPKVILLKMAQSPPKPIDDPPREEELLQNILRKNRELQNGILDENLIRNFFVSQIEAGKMLQRELSLPENKEGRNIFCCFSYFIFYPRHKISFMNSFIVYPT